MLTPEASAQSNAPRIWLGESQRLAVNYVAPGTSAGVDTVAQPVSMVQGDFDQDGITDLAVGFSAAGGGFIAIHRGNLDAFAPQSDASFQAIARGQFPSPFLPQAKTFPVPIRPDFIVAGDFTGQGNTDLAVAARGGSALYVLAGDGKGNFAAPQIVNLLGGVTALAVGDLGNVPAFSNLIVGISAGRQSFLVVYGGGHQGPAPLAVFSLSAPATTIAFGNLDGDTRPDFAVLAGGHVLVYHGATRQLETASLPFSVSALALGSFIFDRDSRQQMALLTPDGAIHIAVHSSFDPRAFTQAEWQQMRQASVRGLPNPLVPAPIAGEGWKIVESFAAAGPFGGGQPPVLLRTRISGNAADDVMILNGFSGQLAVISHPNQAGGATTFLSGQVSTRPYSGSPVAALAMRVNVDGRPGVVAIHQGETAPRLMSPLPDPTFVVDDFTDEVVAGACNPTGPPIAGKCSLREAIIEANAAVGNDTITVPAGTYTLTIADSGTDKHDATQGELSITDGVSIVGAVDGNGNPTTIIQACSVAPTPSDVAPFGSCGGTGIVEKPFSINPNFNKAFDTHLTNLEIRFGLNPGTFAGDGFGGGFDWEASGTGNLFVTNCFIHDNRTSHADGGGITATNAAGGTGVFTISNSTISNNTSHHIGASGLGGGIFIGAKTAMVMTNTKVQNNSAADTGGTAQGGGIYAGFGPSNPNSRTAIHGSTISGNNAASDGGGLQTAMGMLIDSGTIFSGNTSGHNGGGIFQNFGTGETTDISKVTITGNTATVGGGGIHLDTSSPQSLNISFSRLASNTAPTGKNLDNVAATVTATNDWWGTNTPATTINGTVTFDPFIVLTHTASPAKIRINQSSTLTADMSADNHGNGAALAGNLDVLLNLPINFHNAVLGSIANNQTSIQPTTVSVSIAASPTGATESGSTVTITTTAPHGLVTGQAVVISGVGVSGYNGTFVVGGTPTTTTFTYTDSATGLADSGSGTAATAVIGTALATYNAGTSGGQGSADATVDEQTTTANIVVLQPPTIQKAFSPTTVAVGASSTITFTIDNSVNVVPINASFTDSLPTNLVVANPANINNACGGTFAPAPGDTTLSFSNAALAVGTCTIKVDVKGTTDGVFHNSVQILSSDAGNGNTASTSPDLTVINPPTIVKQFGAATIAFGATTSLTLNVSNTNQNQTLDAISFTDTLPNGAPGTLVVATPNGLSNNCSAAPTATAGSGSVTLTGASLAPGASCTVSLNVQGTAAGAANNTVTVSDTTAGAGTPSTAPLTVVKADTTTAVTSSVNPSVFGQSVTFTATVSPVPGFGTPGGTVTFSDGVNTLGTGTLSGGVASFTTSALAAGNHTITTSYGGDTNFNGSTGSLTGNPQVVNAADTTTTVVSSQNPSPAGQPVTFTATVSPVAPGAGTPTGTVTFLDGGNSLGTGTLSGGVAAFTTSGLAAGNHTITTSYVPDTPNFNGSAGSLTGNPQVVTKTDTTLALTSSLGTITLGDTVTFTATVTLNPPGPGTPSGLVAFFDGTTPIGSGTLNQSNPDKATFSTSLLAVGSHSITAIYDGDANFNASPLSSPTSETVNLRGSTTSVALNPTTVSAGQPSTTTVTVTDAGATPPGTPDVFSLTGAPATGRTGFTSTLFADGLVLVSGGTGADGTTVLNSAEIYSVSGKTFSSTGNLNSARTGAVAVLLPNGKVLVAGGSSDGTANGALNTAELFDPVAGTFAASTHNMTAARLGANITLLNTGKVLIAGGVNSGGVLNSAELYDPAADTFTATGNLNAARTGASATLLGTGKVLVAGGSSDGTANGALDTAEVFDPAGNSGAGTFTSVAGGNPTLATGRWQPEAALLNNGKVLVAGGQNSGGVHTSADLYDPVADSFTASAHAMNEARANGSAVALPSGMVLLAGGTTSQTVDLYDGDSDQFNVTGSLLHHLSGSAATLLNNGRVLVVGLNIDNAPTVVSDAELYSPSFNPLGTVALSSSEATDVFGAACVLTPSTSAASTCTSTVTPTQVATSPHTITGTYPADTVHSGSSNTASLTVVPTAPPTIAKAFNASNVAQNSTVNVSFTILNPNPASTLTGISFTDSLPAGLVVATPNNLNSNCGGTVTAVAGSSSISLVGGGLAPPGPPPQLAPKTALVRQTAPSNLASGQCVITIDLLVTGTGTISNTTGPVSANESGPGNASNTATLQVVLAPTVNKAFGAASIPVNGTTSLSFNIANPNTGALLFGIAFTDTLPSGLVVASPNGLTGSCVATSTITANAGSGAISLANLNLPANASCSFSVNVQGTNAGTKNNTSGNITATFDDGSGLFRPIAGGKATASIFVVAPPVIAKAFVPAAIAPGGVSALTFTITDPAVNAVAEAGVAFTDTLPANVVVATPNGLTGACGGTVTATAGTGSISLAGGTIAAAGSCVVSVNVTSSVPGSYTNTTGAVSSTNGGTGNTASATLTVAHANLSITKTHVGDFPRGSTGNNYTITVSDAASAGPTVGTVTVTDTLPNVSNTLVATALSGTGWTCNLGTLTCTRSDTLAPNASYPAITLTVDAPSNIQANVTNTAMVSGGGDPNNHTATDPTHIGPPITITLLVPATQTIKAGNSATFVFAVSANTAVVGNINFACSGVPFGAACSFNPPSENQGDAQVTMTMTTTANTSSALPLGMGRTGPVYAALLFPVAGLLTLAAAGRRGRKSRLRLILFLGGLLALMALLGCGGTSHNGTPIGAHTITVTATSAANPTVSASTQVVVTVQ